MQVNTATASESRDEFLQLLVTQLRHQDPLEPIKQEDFLSQLAQFSTLEGIEKLNGRFEDQLLLQEEVLNLQQLSQAAEFVGRGITYREEVLSQDGETALLGPPTRGVVESVSLKDGQFELHVGDTTVTMNQVIEIHPMSSQEPLTTSQEFETTEEDEEKTESARKRLTFVP